MPTKPQRPRRVTKRGEELLMFHLPSPEGITPDVRVSKQAADWWRVRVGQTVIDLRSVEGHIVGTMASNDGIDHSERYIAAVSARFDGVNHPATWTVDTPKKRAAKPKPKR